MAPTEDAKWDGTERRQPWFRFLWSASVGTLLTLLTLGGTCAATLIVIGRQIEHVINSIQTETAMREAQNMALQGTLTDITGAVNMRLDYVEKREHADIDNLVNRFIDLQRTVRDLTLQRPADGPDERPAPRPRDSKG
jgi:hypothetical protein